jgi:GTPase SAR1 family protein
MSRIVITGGPGAGKTTLLLALQARGYTIVGDSARAIIQERCDRPAPERPFQCGHAHLLRDGRDFDRARSWVYRGRNARGGGGRRSDRGNGAATVAEPGTGRPIAADG